MASYLSTDGIRTPDGDVLTDVLGGAVEDETVVGAGGAPAFLNSWGAGATTPLAQFGPMRFYRHGGRGYIRGVTKGGTPGGVPDGHVFTLPSGYRPAYIETAPVAFSVSDAMAPGAAQAAVTPDGYVIVFSADEDNVAIQADFKLA